VILGRPTGIHWSKGTVDAMGLVGFLRLPGLYQDRCLWGLGFAAVPWTSRVPGEVTADTLGWAALPPDRLQGFRRGSSIWDGNDGCISRGQFSQNRCTAQARPASSP
jgi:hypothetical protein